MPRYIIAPALCLLVALTSSVRAAEHKHPTNTWIEVKSEKGLTVYNRYPTANTRVPQLKVEGVFQIPYADAGPLIWDENYENPDCMGDYVQSANSTRPGATNRDDLFVYHVPWFARMAVRIGSGFRGSVGRFQYLHMNLRLIEEADRTVIAWHKIPMTTEQRKGLDGYEVVRSSGQWILSPIDDGSATAFTYEVEGFPGGKRVPAGLVRWANNAALEVPALLQAIHDGDCKASGHTSATK